MNLALLGTYLTLLMSNFVEQCSSHSTESWLGFLLLILVDVNVRFQYTFIQSYPCMKKCILRFTFHLIILHNIIIHPQQLIITADVYRGDVTIWLRRRSSVVCRSMFTAPFGLVMMHHSSKYQPFHPNVNSFGIPEL